MKRLTDESDVQILLAGLRGAGSEGPGPAGEIQGRNAAETVKALLLPGEIADLSEAVERLTGYRRSTIQEVKNG